MHEQIRQGLDELPTSINDGLPVAMHGVIKTAPNTEPVFHELPACLSTLFGIPKDLDSSTRTEMLEFRAREYQETVNGIGLLPEKKTPDGLASISDASVKYHQLQTIRLGVMTGALRGPINSDNFWNVKREDLIKILRHRISGLPEVELAEQYFGFLGLDATELFSREDIDADPSNTVSQSELPVN